MGWRQHEQVEANLAVMIIGGSVVVVLRAVLLPTSGNIRPNSWASSGIRHFSEATAKTQ